MWWLFWWEGGGVQKQTRAAILLDGLEQYINLHEIWTYIPFLFLTMNIIYLNAFNYERDLGQLHVGHCWCYFIYTSAISFIYLWRRQRLFVCGGSRSPGRVTDGWILMVSWKKSAVFCLLNRYEQHQLFPFNSSYLICAHFSSLFVPNSVTDLR